MSFFIDDAVISVAAEVAEEVVLEVAETSVETTESVSEDIVSKQFGENVFSNDNSSLLEDISPECEMEQEISENLSEQIEKEFSPEVFENVQQAESIENEIPTEVEKIERTSTFEDQTVDNFKFENQRFEFEDKLDLGKTHDADVLRNNMKTVMNKDIDKSISRAHHIVGNETPYAANKLFEVGLDRNDPANGILLPHDVSSPLKGSIHSGRHLQEYYNTVEQRMSQTNTREEVLEVLQSLKEDLFSGDLTLQNNVQPNK